MPGQQDAGRASGQYQESQYQESPAQYQEYGYGQQQDQQDTAAAQARGQQGFAAQQSHQPAAAAAVAGRRARRPARARGTRPAPAGPPRSRRRCRPTAVRTAVARCRVGAGRRGLRGPAGGSYGAQAPEADRYAASYASSRLREQPGYAQSPGYQAQTAQPDLPRYSRAAPADGGSRDGAAASGYATGTATGQGGYQPADGRGQRLRV